MSRRLPAQFVSKWDQWLQHGVAHSRSILGDKWLEIYLTSPIWRFGLSRGVCGPIAWAGVLMPSVDRVGRYFPFTIATKLQTSDNLLSTMLGAKDWFEAAERLALASLDDDFSLERFDAELLELRGLPAGPETTTGVNVGLHGPGAKDNCWHFRLSSESKRSDWSTVAGHLTTHLMADHSLWWSSGSERVVPSLAICKGLPSSKGFSALLDGDWARWQWLSVDARSGREARTLPVEASNPETETERIQWSSAHCTDTGKVRSTNQDALLDSPENGLWVVADGMGGHLLGATASREIIEQLGEITPSQNLRALIETVRERLADANVKLRSAAGEAVVGSTVVALLAVADQCACLWAGDSRAYLYRRNELTRLTRDHSVIEDLLCQGLAVPSDTDSHPQSNVITRAVGGDDTLLVDLLTADACDGDTYLLCSDGLTRELSDSQISAVLSEDTDLRELAQKLTSAALDHGGHDNVTVVLTRIRIEA